MLLLLLVCVQAAGGLGGRLEAVAEEYHECFTVLFRQKTVQNEVASRIDGHEEVEDISKGQHKRVLVSVGLKLANRRVQNHGRRGNLAEEEKNNDRNQHDGYASLLRRSRRVIELLLLLLADICSGWQRLLGKGESRRRGR